MAVTTASDLFIPEVSAEYGRQAFVDNLSLMALMGGAGAPIELANDPVLATSGEYGQRPVFKRISSLVTRRDLSSVAAVTDLELVGGNEQVVKVHKKVGGVAYTLDAGRVSKASAEQISAEIGRQAGEAVSLAVRETLLNAIRGGIAAMSATAHTRTVWNASSRTNLSPEEIESLMDLLGDRREMMSALITRSQPLGDLIRNYQGRGVSGIADVQLARRSIQDTTGRAIYMADSAALTTSDAGFDKYHTLALGPGAVQLGFSLPLTIYPPFLDTSLEQVLVRWRADVDYWIGIRGLAYQVGGANPTDAALLSSANWGVVYTDHREVLLAELVHNYSAN